jgi:hypothetical protein
VLMGTCSVCTARIALSAALILKWSLRPAL